MGPCSLNLLSTATSMQLHAVVLHVNQAPTKYRYTLPGAGLCGGDCCALWHKAGADAHKLSAFVWRRAPMGAVAGRQHHH